jgi:hypothetical protein
MLLGLEYKLSQALNRMRWVLAEVVYDIRGNLFEERGDRTRKASGRNRWLG